MGSGIVKAIAEADDSSSLPLWLYRKQTLVQEVLPVQGVPLLGNKSGVADHAAQLFFRGAVGHSGRADNVFFKHHRANVIAAKAQTELTDLQALRHPA